MRRSRGMRKSRMVAILFAIGFGAALVTQWPEIRRYLKIERM